MDGSWIECLVQVLRWLSSGVVMGGILVVHRLPRSVFVVKKYRLLWFLKMKMEEKIKTDDDSC